MKRSQKTMKTRRAKGGEKEKTIRESEGGRSRGRRRLWVFAVTGFWFDAVGQ